MGLMDKFSDDMKFASESSQQIVALPIGQVKPDPNQVRRNFDEEKLKELSDSIVEQGLQNAIHVYVAKEDSYIILTGERRFRACQLGGLETINCVVYEQKPDDKKIKALQLIENLQREDLNAIETARGFDALTKQGMKPREISRSLSIPESTVSKNLAILKKLKKEWLENIEKLSAKRTFSLFELYNIAKQKSWQKRQALYNKLMESAEGQIDLEEMEVEEEPEKKPTKKDNNYNVDSDELWAAFKRVTKKDKNLLFKYISPKKAEMLLKDFGSS